MTADQLPPIPRPEGSSAWSSLLMVCLICLFYTAVLSSPGLLAVLCEPYRNLDETTLVNFKLTLLLALFALKLLRDAWLLLRRRIVWWEWFVSVAIFLVAWFVIALWHISPLN